jgi:PEP-CTERM motif
MFCRVTIKLILVTTMLLFAVCAAATPFVDYEPIAGPGSLFTYYLTVYNNAGTEPLAGLIVWNGNSAFNLDDTSDVNSPLNWGDIPPFPGLDDGLTYFSFDTSTDVPVDSFLGGFSFVSSTDPGTLTGDDFQMVGIGSDDDEQIPLGDAVLHVPEPSALFLLAPGLALLVRRRR